MKENVTCHIIVKENANILKFNQLFSSHNIVVLEKLCKFIKVITVKVSPPGACSRKCLRTKTCPKTIVGQILVLSRVLDHVLT